MVRNFPECVSSIKFQSGTLNKIVQKTEGQISSLELYAITNPFILIVPIPIYQYAHLPLEHRTSHRYFQSQLKWSHKDKTLQIPVMQLRLSQHSWPHTVVLLLKCEPNHGKQRQRSLAKLHTEADGDGDYRYQHTKRYIFARSARYGPRLIRNASSFDKSMLFIRSIKPITRCAIRNQI